MYAEGTLGLWQGTLFTFELDKKVICGRCNQKMKNKDNRFICPSCRESC